MKTRIAFFAVAVAVFAFVSRSTADTASDRNLIAQIDDIIRECQKIKPGMTRADLLEVFGTEGGLSNATAREFVYRHCSYIKVLVHFTLSPGQSVIEERPTDTITSISRPYLQLSISD
jgi:hypothetical protein